MSRIILHVGTHKTGSTSIQRTLNKNRAYLLKLGVTLFEGSNHSKLHRCFTDSPESFHRYYRSWNRNADQARIKQELKKHFLSKRDTIHLISSEDLSLLSEQSLSDLRDFLLKDCKISEITVVCFMRNPLDYLNSSLQQYIKPGLVTLDEIINDSFPSYRFQGFPEFCGGSMQILSHIYFPIPDKLVNVFGKENTRFFNFELSKKAGLVRSLFSCFLENSDNDWPRDIVFNVSMSHEACVLLAEYNNRNPLFLSDFSINNHRVKSRLVPVLRKIPGRKPALINPDAIKLQVINLKIREVNTIVGSQLIETVVSLPKKFLENDLTYFTKQSIEGINYLLGRSAHQFPVVASNFSLQEIANINAKLDSRCGKKWWQRLIAK